MAVRHRMTIRSILVATVQILLCVAAAAIANAAEVKLLTAEVMKPALAAAMPIHPRNRRDVPKVLER